MHANHNVKSEILTPKDIEDSIDARKELLAVIDYINAMQYRSQIKEFRRSLISVAIKNRFNTDEVDVIAAALNTRDFELSAKSIGHKAAWSPSDNMPPDRGPDWRERQLPRGDRD